MMIEEWSSIFRSFFISAIGQAVGILVCSTMMNARRSIWKLYFYTLTKTLLGIIVIDLYLEVWIPDAELCNFYSAVFSSILSVLTCLMFAYTYQGGFVKTVMGLALGEMATAIITLPSIILVNWLRGSSDLYVYYKPWEVLDLLLIPVTILFLLVLYMPFCSFLKKYRSLRFKRQRVWTIVLIMYFILNQAMILGGFKSNSMFMITMYVFYLSCTICAAAVSWMAYWRYQRRIQTENKFLRAQMDLMGTHYTAIQSQMRKMEDIQKMMEEQMKHLETSEVGRQKENAAEYLKSLHREYENIHAGVYCKDWMVDGILYCQEEAAKKLGIEVEYQFSGYQRGNVAEEDMAQIIFLLLDEGIREQTGKMLLRAGMVKGRIILELQADRLKKNIRFSRRKYQDILKKYDGSIMTEKTETGLQVAVMLWG